MRSRVSTAFAASTLVAIIVAGWVSVLACAALGLIGGALTRPTVTPADAPARASPTPPAIVTITPRPKPTATSFRIQTSVPTPFLTPTLPPTPIHGVVLPGDIIEANRMAFVVRGIERPADELVAQANDFNPPPEPDEEYVLVDISITCLRDPSEVCLLSPLINFKLIGSRVAYAPQILLLDVPHLLEGGEIQGGATTSGKLAFAIDEEETDLTLFYQTIMGTDQVFLALP